MPNESSTLMETPMAPNLLQVYDDFVDLHDDCAFMCEAFASLVGKETLLDESTAIGARRFCHWMKRRMGELKEDLSEINEKAHVKNQASNKDVNV